MGRRGRDRRGSLLGGVREAPASKANRTSPDGDLPRRISTQIGRIPMLAGKERMSHILGLICYVHGMRLFKYRDLCD